MASPLRLVRINHQMAMEVLPVARRRASADGELLPIFVNYGFIPYAKNTLCSLSRLGISNWMVMAMDNETCPALAADFGMAQRMACVYPYASNPLNEGGTGVASYRSQLFNLIVMQRPLWVRWMLSKGFKILQCDTDVVLLHDPFPYFATLPQFDMLFQSEQAHGNNGGFYFARPTNNSIALIDTWLSDLKRTAGSSSFEEQHSLNRALKLSVGKSSALRVAKLNESKFPNGKIWWYLPHHTSKADAYVVHCNWVKFNKKTRLRRDNLWFLTEDDQRCRAGFDPFEDGCQSYCVAVTTCTPGKPCTYETCDRLRATLNPSVRSPVRWHDMAFRSIGCSKTAA